MKITIEKLTLVNFKGIKFLEVIFDVVTNILGRNATGKTTIQDAFCWLLFGKDSEDRKDFGIKTYDESGEIIPKIDHEVHGILNIDGNEVKLSRILKEKWQKRRGEETAEFTGNETVYFINDVPKSQKEYQDYVNSVIPEATFKLLTNPSYFNALPWKDRREMLSSIADLPTDEEVAGEQFKDLLEIMRKEKKSLEDIKKEYASKRLKLKESIAQIPARINEVQRNTPEKWDWKLLEATLKQYTGAKADLESKVLDRSKGVEESVRLRSEVLIRKNNMAQKLSSIEYSIRSSFEDQQRNISREISGIKDIIKALENKISMLKINRSDAVSGIDRLKSENDDLRKRWTERNAEVFVWNEDTCPTCGQQLPSDKVAEKRTKAESDFNAKKIEDLNNIHATGTRKNGLIENLQSQLDGFGKSIEDAQVELTDLLIKLQTAESRETLSLETMLADNAEYQSLKNEMEAIMVPEVVQPDTSDLTASISEVNTQIKDIEAKLNNRPIIKIMEDRREELMGEEKVLSQQIADLEKMEFKIESFQKAKSMMIEDRVNQLFPTLKFRLFNRLVNGSEEPACETLVAGVPYTDANNAGKINAGIEIINTFSKIHNLYAPVFIDNAESVNTLTKTDSQLTRLVVTENESLVVE